MSITGNKIQLQELEKLQAASKRKSSGGLLSAGLGILGTVAGGAIGGPVGAKIGGTIGSYAGSQIG